MVMTNTILYHIDCLTFSRDVATLELYWWKILSICVVKINHFSKHHLVIIMSVLCALCIKRFCCYIQFIDGNCFRLCWLSICVSFATIHGQNGSVNELKTWHVLMWLVANENSATSIILLEPAYILLTDIYRTYRNNVSLNYKLVIIILDW